MIKLRGLAFAIFLALGIVQTSNAQTTLPATKIASIETGWYGEWVVITTEGSGASGCPASDLVFGLEATHPAYEMIVSIALTALSTNADIQIVAQINNCVLNNATRVMAIKIVK